MRCSPPHRCRAASRAPASGSITPQTRLCWRSAFSTPDMRVGIGYDSHRFAEGEGRKLILGGLEIPHTRGLVGHSDADAVAHALTDAILGAAGAGNIGQLFPDTDPQWKDADSMELLRTAHELVRGRGLRLVQADLTVITELPKLQPHLAPMAASLAARLALPTGAIN